MAGGNPLRELKLTKAEKRNKKKGYFRSALLPMKDVPSQRVAFSQWISNGKIFESGERHEGRFMQMTTFPVNDVSGKVVQMPCAAISDVNDLVKFVPLDNIEWLDEE